MPTPNPQDPPKLERPASLVENEGQVSMTKEDFEKLLSAGDKGKADAKKYADEAGNNRRRVDELEKELKSKLEELEKRPSPKPGDEGEIAALNRRIADVEGKWKAAEERAVKAEDEKKRDRFESLLVKLTSELPVVDPEVTADHFRQREIVRLGKDGKLELRIVDNGNERWIDATKENIEEHKILRSTLLKSRGVGGSGEEPPPPRTSKGEILDLKRAEDDQKYYEQHRDAINAARAAKQTPAR